MAAFSGRIENKWLAFLRATQTMKTPSKRLKQQCLQRFGFLAWSPFYLFMYFKEKEIKQKNKL